MNRASVVLPAAILVAGGCLDIGEPEPGDAYVTWAAYPETVLVNEAFPFEFAGPVATSTCGRLDTAVLSAGDSAIELSARRSVFDALCSDERVSFYEARSLTLERAGRYAVGTAEGRDLGTLVAVDSGTFSAMRAVGEGTVREADGCTVFGPGWASNQRPFALRNVPEALRRLAGTDSVVRVEGRFAGFSLCGLYGSQPSIRVHEARPTGREARDFYR